MRINFLEETIEMLKDLDKTWDDVLFIGNKDYFITIDQFKRLADVEYDNSFGAQWMPSDIIIKLDNGMIVSRGEYDGSEWWEYTKPFMLPTMRYPRLKPFKAKMWRTLTDHIEDK